MIDKGRAVVPTSRTWRIRFTRRRAPGKDEYSDLAALKERISALEPCCRGCIQGVNYGPREIFAVDVRWLEDCADKAKGDTTTFFNAGGAERITDLLVRAIERAQDKCLEVFICWRYLNPGAFWRRLGQKAHHRGVDHPAEKSKMLRQKGSKAEILLTPVLTA